MNKFLKIAAFAALSALSAFTLAACSDANVVSQNLSTDADNFKVPRRVVLYNGITDAFIQEVMGFCSLQPSDLGNVAVICKTETGYVKHIWRVSDNVTVFAEQITGINVSSSFYKVIFKPSVIIPAIELR